MRDLAERLRTVRVCCGDWERVCGPSVTVKHGVTGIFLDPPYADEAERTSNLYSQDSGTVAHAVREFALSMGEDPRARIALCGYEGEHAMPDTWECIPWKARGGYGLQGQNAARENSHRERIWFSPHCLRNSLFDFAEHEEASVRLGREDKDSGAKSEEWLRTLGAMDHDADDALRMLEDRSKL
jgi:hypothetical protein